MITLRTISITLLILFVFFSGVLYGAEPTVRSFLDKNEIGVGEKVKLTVEMEWEQREDASIAVTQITPPASKLLEQVDSKQRASSRLGKTGVFARRVLEYIYIGKEKGEGEITPVAIEYTANGDPENKRLIKTRPIIIKVVSGAARFRKMSAIGIAGILLAALVCGMFIVFKKRVMDTGTDRGKIISTDTGVLEKEFCGKLNDLNKHKVSGNMGVYYAELEEILFAYIKKKYDSDLSPESIGKFPSELQKIYAECKFMSEKVRFSGYKPQENEHNKLIRGIMKYMKALIPGENEEDLIETIN